MLTDEQIKKLTVVQAKYADDLLKYPNVIGVGIGFVEVAGQPTEEPALVVMVSKKLPLAQLAEDEVLPDEIEGVTVDVQETGTFTAGSF